MVDGSISSAASVYRRVVVAPVSAVVVAVGVFWAFYAPLRCPLILICLGGGRRREDEQSEEDSPNMIERSTTKKIK